MLSRELSEAYRQYASSLPKGLLEAATAGLVGEEEHATATAVLAQAVPYLLATLSNEIATGGVFLLRNSESKLGMLDPEASASEMATFVKQWDVRNRRPLAEVLLDNIRTALVDSSELSTLDGIVSVVLGEVSKVAEELSKDPQAIEEEGYDDGVGYVADGLDLISMIAGRAAKQAKSEDV